MEDAGQAQLKSRVHHCEGAEHAGRMSCQITRTMSMAWQAVLDHSLLDNLVLVMWQAY